MEWSHAVIIAIIWVLDSVDVVLRRLFGVKLVRLTRARVLGSLTPDELREASKPDVAEPFNKFITGLERDEQLRLFRRFHMLRVIKNIFSVRVQCDQLLRAKPEILEVQIRRPMFIASMPRSGTTFLSRLLGRDPRARSPAMWEMGFPFLRFTESEPTSSRTYCRLMMGANIDTIQRSGAVSRIHVVDPQEPEECVVLTRMSYFQHIEVKRLSCLSEYEEWFYQADHEYHMHMYSHYKKMLQILLYNYEDRYYLLKGNIHLWALDALLATFPDAAVIYNVRPLAQVIASFCSTYDHLFNFYGPVDAGYARRMLRCFSEQTRRVVTCFRRLQQLPPHQNPLFLVEYSKLVEDPMTMVKRIYAKFGVELPQSTVDILQEYIDSHPQNKHGRHKYSLEEYGLTLEQVKQELKPYEEFMNSLGYENVI